MVAAIQATVKISLPGLKKFAQLIKTNSPVVQTILKQWAARYRGFIQKRFAVYSKGGGDWAPLAASTIARRRKGKGKGTIAILRNTGLLFAALAPVFANKPGAFEKYGMLSVTVGYGGPQKHPGSSVTIADIASFHQVGGPNLPQRKIIVPPDADTLDGMSKDAERNLNKAGHDLTK